MNEQKANLCTVFYTSQVLEKKVSFDDVHGANAAPRAHRRQAGQAKPTMQPLR
jgi:hypothetical protein